MSTVLDEQEQAALLASMDIPMAESAPEPESDFNAGPPPLDELYDGKGRQVPYIVNIGLGRNGAESKLLYEYNEAGEKTDKVKGKRIDVDILCRAIAVSDGREIDLSRFNTFLTAPRNSFNGLRNPATSKPQRGKGKSDLVHIAQLCGIDVNAFPTVEQMVEQALVPALRDKANPPQALAYIQWQGESKEIPNEKAWNGKGKVLRYGQKAFDQRPDGTYNPTFHCAETGETITAKAVITRLEPLK